MFTNIKKETVFIAMVSFCTSFSSAFMIVAPISLMQGLNLSLDLIIFIRALGDIAGYLGRVVIGLLSDYFNTRRKFLIWGYAPMLLIKACLLLVFCDIFSIATCKITFAVCNALDKFLNTVRDIPRDALIADNCPKNLLPENLGFRKAIANLGTIFGIIIFNMLLIFSFGAITLVTVSWIFAFIGVLILLSVVKDSSMHQKLQVQGFSINTIVQSMNWKFLLIMLASVMLFAGKLSEWQIYNNFPSLGLKIMGLQLLFYISSAIAAYFHGRIRPIEWNVYILVFLLCGINFTMYYYTHSILLLIGVIIYGAYQGIIDAVLTSNLMEDQHANNKASLLSILNISIALGCFLMTKEKQYFASQYLIGSILPLICGAMLLWGSKNTKQSN